MLASCFWNRSFPCYIKLYLCLSPKLWWITSFNNMNNVGPLKVVELYRFSLTGAVPWSMRGPYCKFDCTKSDSNLCVLFLRNQTTYNAWLIAVSSHIRAAQTAEPWNKARNKHSRSSRTGRKYSDVTANSMISRYDVEENILSWKTS